MGYRHIFDEESGRNGKPQTLCHIANENFEPTADETAQTLCGIIEGPTNDDPANWIIELACMCGHPLCEAPPTCPACIAIAQGKPHA